MRKITLLVDYKANFGTKRTSAIYRNGMDKNALSYYFKELGYMVEYSPFYSIDYSDSELSGRIFLYTSSEDDGLNYKSYIEDVIYGLELRGALVIPSFKYLRAHHNKVFMEIIRCLSPIEELNTISSRFFGTLEELKENASLLKFPVVIKPSFGSMSKGVALANNPRKLIHLAKKLSSTQKFFLDIKDFLRQFKHRGYLKESRYRRKFLTQTFIDGLYYDWKVLVFSKKYYAIKRTNRKNDFRASGGGILSYEEKLPEGLLDFCKKVYTQFNVPFISLDVAFDGRRYHLFEFQFIFFGTYTIDRSPFYFTKSDGEWIPTYEVSVLEKEYANSIVSFLNRNSL